MRFNSEKNIHSQFRFIKAEPLHEPDRNFWYVDWSDDDDSWTSLLSSAVAKDLFAFFLCCYVTILAGKIRRGNDLFVFERMCVFN